MQALQATAAAEAERKANSSKARLELEEQMKERHVLQLQQQVSTPPVPCCWTVIVKSYFWVKPHRQAMTSLQTSLPVMDTDHAAAFFGC